MTFESVRPGAPQPAGVPRRWSMRMRRLVATVNRRLSGSTTRSRRPMPSPPRREHEPEVFAVLRLQMRLTTLTSTLRRIDADPTMFARQHHWRTTLEAYDALLAQACVMAGVEVVQAPPGPKADAERSRRELQLCSCGWTW